MSDTSKFPSHYEIAHWWAKNELQRRFVIDVGEPSCFACFWCNESETRHRSLKEIWKDSGLERAHIIPDCIAKNYRPSNFVLLCARCHLEAPMCHIPTILPDWCERREKRMGGYFLSDWDRELKAADITWEQFNEVRNKVFKITAENFAGWHWGEGIPVSTFTMIAAEIIHGGLK